MKFAWKPELKNKYHEEWRANKLELEWEFRLLCIALKIQRLIGSALKSIE